MTRRTPPTAPKVKPTTPAEAAVSKAVVALTEASAVLAASTRTREEGRYDFDTLDHKCVCGHTLGDHSPKNRDSKGVARRPCLAIANGTSETDCVGSVDAGTRACINFRKARVSAVARPKVDVDRVLDWFMNTADGLPAGVAQIKDLTGIIGDQRLAAHLVKKRNQLRGTDVQDFTRPSAGDAFQRTMIQKWIDEA